MINIGIIGAENSHCAAVAGLINVQKKVPGCKVVAVWGERPVWAKNSAARGQIEASVLLTEDILPGVVSLPHGFGMNNAEDGVPSSGPSINELTSADRCDAIAKTPFHKQVPVRISKASSPAAATAS